MNCNSPLKIKVTKSIAEIDKNEWDGIFPPGPESYNFFKTIDETLTRQFKPYYILIYENAHITAAAPCFVMDYPLDTTVEGPLKKVMAGIKNLAPQLFTLRVLICGCQTGAGKIGVRDPGRRDIALALANEMRAIAEKENARLIAFKDFPREYAVFFEHLLKIGFHKMRSYPSVELDIHFNSFDAYLASLSRATRKGLKKKFKQVEDTVTINMEIAPELGGRLDQAYALYLNTFNKSEVRFERLSKEFFENISKNMPGETKYFLWSIKGKLAAFDLCLVSKDVLVDEYIGLDYDVAYQYHLYYVTFRDMIIWCLHNGIHTYKSGALNYDPKKRLDFKFIPAYIYFKHTNPLLNLMFGVIRLFLKPENFDPVLKSMENEN